MSRLAELKAEYKRLINSMEFAYAMGHHRTIGSDPRLDSVRERAGELERQIRALSHEPDE